MENKNLVFIATSIDGYIADENGNVDWLQSVPNPDQIDMGYSEFTSQIDALIMGRTTFDTICSFGIDWPYQKPVFVLSNTMKYLPKEYEGKVELVKGNLKDVLNEIHEKGFHKLYIDGGKTIQSFLKEDLIDEMIITLIPTLLGGGIPLFAKHSERLGFDCVESKIFLGKVVQNRFVRNKE